MFYRGGKVIARYTMPELVVRMDLVTVSTSHTNWVMRGTRPDNVLGKTLDLVTTSQRAYQFDVASGKQIKADDTDDWKTCAWIVYAGEFRSYGQLLIINAGGGYHILLAGLSQIDAQLGQFVLAGEPVGVMSAGANSTQAKPQESAPILYIEFRKDQRPIDPDAWWSDASRKMQG